jgi:hypothetical protein
VYSSDLLNGSVALSVGGAGSGASAGSDVAGNAGSTSGASGFGGMPVAGSGPVTEGDAGQVDVGGSGGSAGGKGGTTGNAGSGAAGGVLNTAGATAVDTTLIDDFEDNDKIITIVNSPRRDGIWDTGNDATVGGVQTPTPSMFVPSLLGANAPHADDMYAAHSTGSGFTTYGAYMNVSMRAVADYLLTPYYDASSYKGVSFLAKASAASGKSMRVRFVSGDTDPRGKKCVVGGTQTQACYNHYYAIVTLTASWATYSLDFDSFIQGGDGMVDPTIDLKEMYGLEFYFNPPGNYDLWLDDLKFTK